MAGVTRYTDLAHSLVERLCRQPSVAAQDLGMEEMADLVERELHEAGFTTQKLSIMGSPPIVYGEQRGRSPYTVLLYNHYDVQPADPVDLWNSPPFETTLRDGNLYARGISDNKGEIAVRLAAIHALREMDGELPITLRWIVEGQEEVGSADFAEIVEPHAELLRADGCFWEGEGFDDKSERPLVSLGTKGILYVELRVECMTVDAHSGRAATLPSAAWRLVEALSTLRSREGRVQIPGFYDVVQPATDADRAALEDQSDLEFELREMYGIDQFVNGLSGVALRERSGFTPTCNIAGIGSGYTGAGVKTVLPANATAKIDFRLVPDQTAEAVLQALRAHLSALGYADIDVRVLAAADPVRTPQDDPFVRRVLEVTERFNGKRAEVTPLVAGTLPFLGALQHFVGIPGLMPPTNVSYWGSKAHAPNEHIRLSDLYRAVAFNIHLLRGLGE